MQLTPREAERLLIFTAAELARRRLREGILLSHPDCVALACDVAMEAARAGRSYEEVQASVDRDRRARPALSGVPELLEQPLQVEATFGDGSRLVALARAGAGVRPGEIIPADAPAPAAVTARTATVAVTNAGRFDAYLTSHFPLARASAALESSTATGSTARAR